MSYYNEIMSKAMAKANLIYGIENEGDYYKDDGRGHEVLYCKECAEAKQFWLFQSTEPYSELEQRIEKYGVEHPALNYYECQKAVMSKLPPRKYIKELNEVVGVPCRCQRDYNEGKARAERNEARRKRIIDNKNKCFSVTEMQKINFSDYEENKHIKACKKYAKKFNDMRYEGKGLVLCGRTGSGKTIATICMANDLLDREYSVGFKLQHEITYAEPSDRNELIKELLDYTLLIIDDFNLDYATDYGKDLLFYVLEKRIEAKTPTVLTSNISKEGLSKAKGLDKRLCDRLCDEKYFYIVENSSKNYRRANGNTGGRSRL